VRRPGFFVGTLDLTLPWRARKWAASRMPRMLDKPLAVVRSYDELLAAIRNRVDELGVTRDGLDTAAGLPDHYITKILSRHPIRRLGLLSLGGVLGALKLKLVVCEDELSQRPLPERRQNQRRTAAPANGAARP
jgi:hypothetical protein